MILASLYDIMKRTVGLLGGVDRDLSRSDDYLSAANVFPEVQSAYLEMTEMGKKFNRFELLEYRNAELVTTGNLSQLDIRWNSRRGQIVGLFKRQQGEQFETPTALELRAFFHPVEGGMELVGDSEWRISNGTIYVLRNTTWLYRRLWHLRKPGTLNQGTVTSATANAIVLPASPTYGSIDRYDDAYKNDYLRIVSGAGVNQIVRITAWDSATLTATVAPLEGSGDAFPTLPTSSSTYSILPWFPEEHCDALAHLTATRKKKIDLSADIAGEAGRKMGEFNRFVAQDDKVSPIRIVNTARVQDGLMGDVVGAGWWYGTPAPGSVY
jgi:hypothetical protein